MLQVCLPGVNDLAAFQAEMRSIAQVEKMKFIDGSENTKSDLDAMDPKGRAHDLKQPLIHLAVERHDGMGAGAGNQGLPQKQVAIGFSRGSDRAEAERFAERVRSRLERRWRVEPVPPGEGAKGMKQCPGPLRPR
jgi:hypothetical protein